MSRQSTAFRTLSSLLLALAIAVPARGAEQKPRVLFVMSSADHLTLRDRKKIEVGFYSTEFAVPWKILAAGGVELDVATPGGKRPTVGAKSLDPKRFKGGAKEANELKEWLAKLPELQKPLALEKVDLNRYFGIFVPGGMAPMQDLMYHPALGKLLADAYAQGRVVAALCHGPAVLLSASAPGGKNPFKGLKVTAYSNAEESDGLDKRMKVTPEDGLKAMGAEYSKAPKPHSEWVVQDRNLITGENPESAQKLGRTMLEALKGVAE